MYTIFSKIRLLLIFAAFSFSSSVFAIGLGESRVLSKLGEPIKVEIEILQWEGTELRGLEANLASEANFAAFGLDFLPALNNVELSILGPVDNQLFIQLSGTERMQEPFMEVLIRLRWPGGSLLREYILLFDPPVLRRIQAPSNNSRAAVTTGQDTLRQTSEERQTAFQEELQVEATAITNDLAALDETKTSEAPIVEAPVETELNSTFSQSSLDVEPEPELLADDGPIISNTGGEAERQTYVVRAGDSLWDIAIEHNETGESDESFYQLLLGLFTLNPTAFESGNISRLKVNEEIVIPNDTDLIEIDLSSAESNYNQLWERGTGALSVELEAELIVSNIAPANEPAAEEARFVTNNSNNEPVLSNLPESEEEQVILSETARVTETITVLTDKQRGSNDGSTTEDKSEANIVDETAFADSMEIQAFGESNSAATDSAVGNELPIPAINEINSSLSPIQGIVDRRVAQMQALQTTIQHARQQLRTVQALRVTVRSAVDSAEAFQKEQEKRVNRAAYALIGLAFLMTLALILYVFKSSPKSAQ